LRQPRRSLRPWREAVGCRAFSARSYPTFYPGLRCASAWAFNRDLSGLVLQPLSSTNCWNFAMDVGSICIGGKGCHRVMKKLPAFLKHQHEPQPIGDGTFSSAIRGPHHPSRAPGVRSLTPSPMRHYTSILRTVIGCAALLLLTGCLAPPKRHAWQITRQEFPELRESAAWPQLSTNDYVRVPDSQRQNAVALLQEHPFIQLGASQLSVFAPGLAARAGQPYLVRGVSFSSRPDFTVLRFDTATGRLLVQQFTWNGEMLMPFRWVAEPNALVVFLPRSPEHIYPDAILGGDSIFRGRKSNTLDSR
jgi:hypothetical protein